MTILLSMASGAFTQQAAASTVRTIDRGSAVSVHVDVAGKETTDCTPASRQAFVIMAEPPKCKMGPCRSLLCVGDYLSPVRAELGLVPKDRPAGTSLFTSLAGIAPDYVPPPPKPALS